MKRLFALFASRLANPLSGFADMKGVLDSLCDGAGVPALAAAVIVEGKLRRVEVAGIRKRGDDSSVAVEDKWHIGSCTKAMTATLAATFVEEGLLSWETTVEEVFSGALKDDCPYRDVTLLQLLTHSSGIPGTPTPTVWSDAWDRDGEGEIRWQRAEFVDAMLGAKPVFAPGTGFEYSNAGYVLVGVMMEFLSDSSWEDLMRHRIFGPLGMSSAGFGNAAREGTTINQPWPHNSRGKPKEPGKGDDNPAALGPAGTVHCSLADLSVFVKMHLCRETGLVLQRADTYNILHRVFDAERDYACGWVVVEREWAGDDVALTHSGSNTMNYCVIWLAPARKFAAMVVTNGGSRSAARVCDKVVEELIRRFLEEKS